MPENISVATATPPKSGDNEGEGHRHVSRDEARGIAWLTWRSHGCERGLKRHKIATNGYVHEIEERPIEPRRKSKAISTKQFGGR